MVGKAVLDTIQKYLSDKEGGSDSEELVTPAYVMERAGGIPEKITLGAFEYGMTHGFEALATGAAWAAIGASIASFEMLLGPLNFALYTVVKWDTEKNEIMDSISVLPEKSKRCGEIYANAMKWVVEYMLIIVNNDKELLNNFLSDDGIAQCEWQPTSKPATNFRGARNDGLFVYHGEEALHAVGENIWGWILDKMKVAYTMPHHYVEAETGYHLVRQTESTTEWKEILTNDTYVDSLSKFAERKTGLLDKYAFARSTLCGPASPRPNKVTRMLKRILAMFTCQIKAWFRQKVDEEDADAIMEELMDGAVQSITNRGLEGSFRKRLEDELETVDLDMDAHGFRGKSLKEILKTGMTVETGRSIVDALVSLAQL
jgi:hypothetical protein